MVVLHELCCIAGRAADEALVDLLGRRDVHGRISIVVERAQPDHLSSLGAELDALADDLDNVRRVEYTGYVGTVVHHEADRPSPSNPVFTLHTVQRYVPRAAHEDSLSWDSATNLSFGNSFDGCWLRRVRVIQAGMVRSEGRVLRASDLHQHRNTPERTSRLETLRI